MGVWVLVSVVCVVMLFGDNRFNALGRVIVFVVWLALTALFVGSSARGAGPPTPSPQSTPTDPMPVPTFDRDRIRCTTFDVPNPTDRTTESMTCCALWTGNRWGQGTWTALGCR